MDAQERERLEKEIKAQLIVDEFAGFKKDCVSTHKEVTTALMRMEAKLGAYDERFKQIFGDLKDGDTFFDKLLGRVEALEKFQANMTGRIIGTSAAVAFVMTLIGWIVTIYKIGRG